MAFIALGFALISIGAGVSGHGSASAGVRSNALDPNRSATASKTEDLDNEVVTISWSGFTPTGQDGSNNTIVVQCIADPQSLADCFTAEPYPAIANGNRKFGKTLDDGTGSVQFEVRAAAQLPALGCSATRPCSVMVYESTAEAIPVGELPSTAAVVELNFIPSIADCPPVVDFDLRFDGSASAAPQFYRWAADKCGGNKPLVIDYTNSNDNTGRENFLNGLVDGGVSGLAATKEELDHHSESVKFKYAPVDLTAVVIAINMRDPMTGQVITDLTLTPRLVAKMVTDSDVTNLFTDPEFRRLNSRIRLPISGVEYPLLRAEKNSDSYIVTSWMIQDENAQKFLAGEDTYLKQVNPAYLGLEYPRDIFENVAQSANFLPRQGQNNVALKLFYGISPSGTSPLNLAETGLLGIVDLPTAQRFGLATAKIVNAAGVAVAPTEESILAGFAEMQQLRNGTRVNNFASLNEAAYPLVKVDYLMVPFQDLETEKNKLLQSFLKFVAGDGQDLLLPGYIPLPEDLRAETLAVVDVLKENLVPDSTTTTTTSTTTTTTTTTVPTTSYRPSPQTSVVEETTTTTSAPVTTTVVTGNKPLAALPDGQSMAAIPFFLVGAILSSLGLFGGVRRKSQV